jgi:hypothetical protein
MLGDAIVSLRPDMLAGLGIDELSVTRMRRPAILTLPSST